jgi:predicted NUDIX family NTP pyrophosphohydrolase
MAINGRINAGVIIYRVHARKLQVLLVHQSDKRKNLWSIPKGGVEPMEEFDQAARREVQEETNVTLGELDFLGYVDYGKVNKRLYCYMSEFPEGASIKCKFPEIDNAGFFEVPQAKKMVEKRQRVLLNAMQKIFAFGFRRGA